MHGIILAECLINLSEFGEAKTLLEELKPHSMQVHGRTHPETRTIEDFLQICEFALKAGDV